MVRDWRLNERHYGALQGLNKAETKEEYGEESSWHGAAPMTRARRSWPMTPSTPRSMTRYADLEKVPQTECLKDVVARFVPYFEEEILPRAKKGETVLIAAHGNSLRALVKHLDNISDDDIAGLNIPTGIPLVYEITEDGSVVNPGGTYLIRKPPLLVPPPLLRRAVSKNCATVPGEYSLGTLWWIGRHVELILSFAAGVVACGLALPAISCCAGALRTTAKPAMPRPTRSRRSARYCTWPCKARRRPWRCWTAAKKSSCPIPPPTRCPWCMIAP